MVRLGKDLTPTEFYSGGGILYEQFLRLLVTLARPVQEVRPIGYVFNLPHVMSLFDFWFTVKIKK